MLKRSLFVIGGLLLVLAALVALKWPQMQAGQAMLAAMQAPPTHSVSAVEVVQVRWRPQIAAVGTLNARAGTLLSLEVAGTVTQIPFVSGDKIERGALLLKLDDSIEQANLTSAEAQLDLAQIKHDRNKVLFKRNNISEIELAESAASLKMAQASVQQLRASIDKKALTAPFAGTLGIRQVDPGQYLKAGDPVVTLQDLTALYADFAVPEQYLPELYVGQEVQLRSSAYPEEVFTGAVIALEAKVDENTRNIALRAELPNDDGRLRPGMYAEIHLLKRDNIEPVVVPATAVAYSPFGDSVYVVRQDEEGALRAYRQYITLGEQRGDQIAVLDGLSVGDQVVDAGTQKLDHQALVRLTSSLSAQR
ncbi:efflux RND transporter periplasmic adaptor subunit [Ferrimonas marina]|uniref:Membrane fusion protein, multidrug efflux system n=1 Tax=Ferrimonas marina TaxID=299255 RepID=A0A1M5XUL4_9GAMM|nr:efflux RND transporter periplasmic adaptor subunit [Ferrimonas marina]SHI03228.1 membrane fusion protein, multidrug efflux system [Ferrimonas marina]